LNKIKEFSSIRTSILSQLILEAIGAEPSDLNW